MTDKQNFEVNARFEYGAYLTPKVKDKGINNITDKQITIDYKTLCENYSKEVGCCNTFDGSCSKKQCFTYRLLQLLKAKEQECEELKKCLLQVQNASTSLNKQLDKLKVENDLYKNAHKTEQDRRRSYENALTEIKDIAEPFCDACQEFEPEKNKICMYCNCGKILHKISEAENEN